MIRGLPAAVLLLCSCALQASHTAQRAERRLIGLSRLDLETCLGVSDRQARFGNVALLTYDALAKPSGLGIDFPLLGGISFVGGGYCHATFRLLDGRVVGVQYTGAKDGLAAPSAYCAPIVRSCLNTLDASDPSRKAQLKLPEAWRTD